MAPERLARGARSPNGLHRSKREQGTWRARRLWRAHASPGAKERKCHDGAWNTLTKTATQTSDLTVPYAYFYSALHQNRAGIELLFLFDRNIQSPMETQRKID